MYAFIFPGRSMDQAVSRWPFTTEGRVRAQVSTCGICGGQSGTGTGFPPSSSVSLLLVTIPPLLHTHLSPPHEVSDSPDQAAHYHTAGTKLGASSVTTLSWSRSKVVKVKGKVDPLHAMEALGGRGGIALTVDAQNRSNLGRLHVCSSL
jgi:hypothetical protein